jgi:hypothetical protein
MELNEEEEQPNHQIAWPLAFILLEKGQKHQ